MLNTKILIVAATLSEVDFLLQNKYSKKSDYLFSIHAFDIDIDLLITGVGQTAMAYRLSKQLFSQRYNFSLLLGIAGAYSQNIEIGEVVNVVTERFADLGIVKENEFIDLFDMNLEDANRFPFENKILKNYTLINNKSIENLKEVNDNTVQCIRPQVLSFIQKNTDVESMEGASYAYICALEKIPYAQIRSISNYVGEQNKNNWNIPLAVSKLGRVVEDILQELSS